jgi:uncharacterized protein YukE
MSKNIKRIGAGVAAVATMTAAVSTPVAIAQDVQTDFDAAYNTELGNTGLTPRDLQESIKALAEADPNFAAKVAAADAKILGSQAVVSDRGEYYVNEAALPDVLGNLTDGINLDNIGSLGDLGEFGAMVGDIANDLGTAAKLGGPALAKVAAGDYVGAFTEVMKAAQSDEAKQLLGSITSTAGDLLGTDTAGGLLGALTGAIGGIKNIIGGDDEETTAPSTTTPSTSEGETTAPSTNEPTSEDETTDPSTSEGETTAPSTSEPTIEETAAPSETEGETAAPSETETEDAKLENTERARTALARANDIVTQLEGYDFSNVSDEDAGRLRAIDKRIRGDIERVEAALRGTSQSDLDAATAALNDAIDEYNTIVAAIQAGTNAGEETETTEIAVEDDREDADSDNAEGDDVAEETTTETTSRQVLATTGAPVGAIAAAALGLIGAAGGAAALRRR